MRTIIHLNVADFAAAVETVLDPRLSGRPLIVAAGASRVYDMNEAAYRMGVRKHMSIDTARRRCRDATVVLSRPDRYVRAMQEMVKRAAAFTPRVEPGDADGHLFLDVTGTGRLHGPALDVAWRLRRQTRSDLGIDPIWSVAPSKRVAKTATRLVKPSGEYVVAEGEEARFLADLPLDIVAGFEAEDIAKLRSLHLVRPRDIARLSGDVLEDVFGSRASYIRDVVLGIDASPVRGLDEVPAAIRLEKGFDPDTEDPQWVEGGLFSLVERAGAKIRRMGLSASMVSVRLTYADGGTIVRRFSCKPATAIDARLFEAARSALSLCWCRRIRIRHIVLTCSKLVFPSTQLPLFEDPLEARQSRLCAVIDTIRSRFGRGMLMTGRGMAEAVYTASCPALL